MEDLTVGPTGVDAGNVVVRGKPNWLILSPIIAAALIVGAGVQVEPMLIFPWFALCVVGLRYYFSRSVVECKKCGWKAKLAPVVA